MKPKYRITISIMQDYIIYNLQKKFLFIWITIRFEFDLNKCLEILKEATKQPKYYNEEGKEIKL